MSSMLARIKPALISRYIYTHDIYIYSATGEIRSQKNESFHRETRLCGR